MLHDFAQKIAQYTSEMIGYDVIITDENAVIIGASDSSRIKSIHEGSYRVIKTGKENEVSNFVSSKGNKCGITLPIYFAGKIMGTIGITGRRKDVEKIAKLVKRQAEVMLEEKIYFKSSFLREQSLVHLIQDILVFDSINVSDIVIKARALEFNYDLNPPHVVIAINKVQNMTTDMSKIISKELYLQSLKTDNLKNIKSIFSNANDMVVALNDHRFIILYALNYKYDEEDVFEIIEKKCLQLIEKFKLNNICVKIGISSIAKNISELSMSCREAWRSLEIGKKLNVNSSIYNVNEYYLEGFIASMEKRRSESFSSKVLKDLRLQSDWSELSKTIRAWCESGFSQTEAATILYIHRNTLSYRLNKISQISGKDLKKFKDAHLLYLAVLMEEFT